MINQNVIVESLDFKRMFEDDWEAFSDIARACIKETYSDLCSAEEIEHFLSTHYNRDVLIEELCNANKRHTFAICNGEVAGFSSVVFKAPHPDVPLKEVSKLENLYVLKKFQYLQLGLNMFLGSTHIPETDGMWLYIWVHNKSGIGFFERMNFKVVGEPIITETDEPFNPQIQMFLDYEDKMKFSLCDFVVGDRVIFNEEEANDNVAWWKVVDIIEKKLLLQTDYSEIPKQVRFLAPKDVLRRERGG